MAGSGYLEASDSKRFSYEARDESTSGGVLLYVDGRRSSATK
jgi:hypothetical protein